MESLDSSGIHVGYAIIDDGWQRVNQHTKQLQSFEANEKFPHGLKSLIQEVKEKYFYLKHIGVWHTIWGYWNGIDPNSGSFESYQFERINQGERGDDESFYIVTAKFVKSFYDDFYKYLSSQGVNLIKADYLASFDSIKCNEVEHLQWWRNYLEALRKGNKKYFKNRIIYSMPHSSQIMQEILLKDDREEGKDDEDEDEDVDMHKPILRNSDDFFPYVYDSHSWHIYTNTMNNVWTSLLNCIPDWWVIFKFNLNFTLFDINFA